MSNKTEEEKEEIELIRGDPKKALVKLAIPMSVGMILLFLNSIIDSIWVAGLGEDALAGLGFVTPLFFIILGVGSGLGAGASSFIARAIGEKDHEKANNGGIHSIILAIVMAIIVTLFTRIFLKDILMLIGAGKVIIPAMDYGTVIVSSTIIFVIIELLTGILRGEGDMKRANSPFLLVAVLNMIMDPIFIYALGLGLKGAAIATVIAQLIGALQVIYWIFVKKDTYIKINRKYFRQDMAIYKDIILVSIPAALEEFVMSVTSIIVNAILISVSGVASVAVFTAGWRLLQIAVMPAMGVGISAITVAGVAYGEKDNDKLTTTLNYGVKIGLISSAIIAVVFLIFANQIAYLFSYSSSNADLAEPIAMFLRIMVLYLLAYPIGYTATSVFQALGKGTLSIIFTANRNLILDVLFAGIAAYVLIFGANGVYLGISMGELIGSIITYLAARYYINKLLKDGKIFKKESSG